MDTTKDGGPAFPVPGQFGPIGRGMTLRDWFAGQALSAVIAHEDPGMIVAQAVARDCYQIADAMLVERSKTREV